MPDEIDEPYPTDGRAPASDESVSHDESVSPIEARHDQTRLKRAQATRIRFGYAYLADADASHVPPYYLTRLMDGSREIVILISTN